MMDLSDVAWGHSCADEADVCRECGWCHRCGHTPECSLGEQEKLIDLADREEI